MSDTAPPTPNGSNGGRDPAGRFAPGNRGGPGNPYARQVAALRSALLASVTAEDMRQLGRALLDQARAGDAAAARVLLAYLLGRPGEAPDPERLGEQEDELTIPELLAERARLHAIVEKYLPETSDA